MQSDRGHASQLAGRLIGAAARGRAEIAILFSDTALDDEIEVTFEPIRFELTIAQSSSWYDG